MDLVYAFILGIIEGITEWLPISSTAHLIIFEKLFLTSKYSGEIFSIEFLEVNLVVIQLGSILAVVVIYFKELYPFAFNEDKNSKYYKLSIWGRVLISMIPIVVIGLLLDSVVVELFYNLFTISIMLILYGVLFIVFDSFNKKQKKICDVNEIKVNKALSIGFIQLLALIPGTSRSGVTILCSGFLGLDRKTAVKYSFFLSIPVMFGASILKLIKYLMVNELILKQVIILFVGGMVAFMVSMIIVKKLILFINKINFKVFGYYRIALAIILLLVFF